MAVSPVMFLCHFCSMMKMLQQNFRLISCIFLPPAAVLSELLQERKTVAELALPLVILTLTEFHRSLPETVRKIDLNFHGPIIFSPLSWVAETKPPTTSSTKATPGAARRTLSSSCGFSDPVFIFFPPLYIANTIQCMTGGTAKCKLPHHWWPEGKGAVISVQILLLCLTWSTEQKRMGQNLPQNESLLLAFPRHNNVI